MNYPAYLSDVAVHLKRRLSANEIQAAKTLAESGKNCEEIATELSATLRASSAYPEVATFRCRDGGMELAEGQAGDWMQAADLLPLLDELVQLRADMERARKLVTAHEQIVHANPAQIPLAVRCLAAKAIEAYTGEAYPVPPCKPPQVPMSVMFNLRERAGLKREDDSHDAELEALPPHQKLGEVLAWELGNRSDWGQWFLDKARACGYRVEIAS